MNRNQPLKICRACLEPTQKSYPLFGAVVNVDVNIASMISYCISDELQLDDDLPDSVCIPCFKIIRIAYNFLQQFKESQERLQQTKNLEGKRSFIQSDASNQSEDVAIISVKDRNYTESSLKVSCSTRKQLKPKMDDNTAMEFDNNVDENMLEDNSEESVNPSESNNIVPSSSGDSNSSNVDKEVAATETKKVYAYFVSKTDAATLNFFICPMCKTKFIEFHKFTSHVLLHNSKTITCDKCPMPLTFSMSNYIKHYTELHRYQCNLCGKNLTSNYGFRYHMKHHKNIREFVCPMKNCSKSFFLRHLLKKHMLTHSKTVNYKCNLCNADFKTYDTLRYHKKTHDGKRSHLCTHCGKTFLQAVHLRDHMYVHMDYKQFTCEGCGRSFTTNSQLKKHFNHCHG